MKLRIREDVDNAEAPWLQIAALPWRLDEDDHRFLLLSSRETRRWVIPKGWPMRGKSLHQAAAIEALEEGGLKGRISEDALGHYHYFKRRKDGTFMPCRVRVFSFQVIGLVAHYREAGQREQRWFTAAEAAEAVDEPELRELILSFTPPI